MRCAWICYLLPIMFALGCEAIAKFDRDKIGQPSAPPSTIPRRDGGPVRVDAAAEEEEEEEGAGLDAGEEELDAGEEDLDAAEEELDASEPELDAEQGGEGDAGAPAEGGADGSLDGAPASAEAATDAAPEEADAQGADAAS